ncbi:hypothetical protein PM082_018295 [Marasmius tenuissimus]|nr:hypothetical protein PM082_018295 [Marasmius tenuissimus]
MIKPSLKGLRSLQFRSSTLYSTSSTMAATIDISLKFGPMLIGVFMNMILFGILIMQTLFYYQTYSRDTMWMRLFVAYLFILETANSAFDMAMMYEPLIAGFGSNEAVARFPTLFMTEPILMALIAFPIQLFFAWRIQRVTGIWWISAIIALLALASCAGGIWTGVMVGVVKTFARKPELHTPALVWFLTSCVADVLITISLVRSLSQRKTGFTVTDSVIDKIIRTTVQTGMITAVCAIGDVVFFMTLERTALNFIWDLMLSKLYANCLLSTLNSRASLRGDLSGHAPSSREGRNNMLEPSMMSTRDRRQTAKFNQSHSIPLSTETGVYELENTKSFGGVSQYSSRDLEYGITVTKVVEQVQDPEPISAARRVSIAR